MELFQAYLGGKHNGRDFVVSDVHARHQRTVCDIDSREAVVREVESQQIVGVFKQRQLGQLVVREVEIAYGEHVVEGDARQLVIAQVDVKEHVFLIYVIDAADVERREVVAGKHERFQQAIPAKVDVVASVDAGVDKAQCPERTGFAEVDRIQGDVLHIESRYEFAFGYVYRNGAAVGHARHIAYGRCRFRCGGVFHLAASVVHIKFLGSGFGSAVHAETELNRSAVRRHHRSAERDYFVVLSEVSLALDFEFIGAQRIEIKSAFRERIVGESHVHTVGNSFKQRNFAVGVCIVVVAEGYKAVGVGLARAVEGRGSHGAFAQHFVTEINHSANFLGFGHLHVVLLVGIIVPFVFGPGERGESKVIVAQRQIEQRGIVRQVNRSEMIVVDIQIGQMRIFRDIKVSKTVAACKEIHEIGVIGNIKFLQPYTDVDRA